MAFTAEEYFQRGLEKYEQGLLEEAIADWTASIALHPNYALAYGCRGIVRSELSDKRDAILDYDKAIELDPNIASGYLNRGTAKSELGDKRGAILDYDKAIKLEPNHALAYANRGAAKSELGDNRGAILDFDKAIEINPNLALAHANRGIVFEELGVLLQAHIDFNRFLFLTDKRDFFKATRQTFRHFSTLPAPYLLYRSLQKFTDDFEQFNTIHPIVDATRQQCRPWKTWEEWRRLSGSEQHEPLAYHHALALVNHYLGDPVEAFRIYDEVLDNEEKMGVPLNLPGQYYYLESAKQFREPHEAILAFALEQIEATQAALIAQNAFRELYYAGLILWANDQPEAAHAFFERADPYLPAAYMQVLSLAATGAKTDLIRAKIAQLREREAALPPTEAFLHGFPARPFRLDKPGEDFLTPVLHYAHYREIAEAIAELRQSGESFEHHDLWNAFYWRPDDLREIEWQQRRGQLAELNRVLLEKFRQNVAAGKGVHELNALERAFAEKLNHDLWTGTHYLDFEDFKQKSAAWPDATKDLAAFVRTSRRLDDNDKMLLVEYCFLRGSLSIEDTFLLYFYIDYIKHPRYTDAAAEGLGEAGKELVKLVVAPDTIFGQLLTALGAGAAVRLFGEFWLSRHQTDHIDMDDYRPASAPQTAYPDDFDLFSQNFLRFMSWRRTTLGEEKFMEQYPLDGFEDWKRRK